MKIRYSQKTLQFYLLMTIFWFAIGVGNILLNNFENWTSYAYSGISMMFMALYLFDYFNHYVTIHREMIQENHPFGKKMYFSEIKEVHDCSGVYVLKSEYSHLRIDTHIIEPASLDRLNATLKELNVIWS